MSHNTMINTPDIDPYTGKPDWSRRNAMIVGNVPVSGAPKHPLYAPGIEADKGPYYILSFGGREYKDDEDGWQTIVRRRRRSPRPPRRRRAND
jgi:hypothetical protein